jgi:glycine/D-amino acid oxidase-like deaminating enzyme
MSTVNSVWEKEAWLADVDVAIAGAGFLGLWTALELKRRSPGLRILVLEQSAIPMGASTRNAGFACFGSPSELLYDAQHMGTSAMLDVVEMRFRGIQKIRATLDEASFGFEACGGFECYEKVPDDFADAVAQLNSWLAPIMGLQHTYTNVTSELPTMHMEGFSAMYKNALEGCIHSGKLVHQLSSFVGEQGVQFLYGAKVESWEKNGAGVELHTSRGRLRAGSLVLATNAYLQQMAPSLGIKPARGQVMVTEPIQGLKMHGTFHFDEGFYYWRHLGNRILLGGARNADFAGEETLESTVSEVIQSQLEQFLIRHLPAHFNASSIQSIVSLRWGGLMAMSPDKKPVLVETEKAVWAAMCCNGMGVALAPVFAERVAAAVLTS